ncbi:MAG: disulfide bond formation protein DsbA [Phenylobacterium sp.]|jgi:2-hydroxychromene-2-carboxylate isomerase|nr:disulfide bond formation protein DsbA [Phenylobacterium sp.]
MTRQIEFLFDVGSPTSYLAHKRLPAVLRRTEAEVTYLPILLGGVFRATGNVSPATIPAKGRWMDADLARFAAREGIVFVRNPYFPINTLHLMRGATGLIGDPRFMAYVEAVFDAMWREPRNLGDPAEVAAVLGPVGIEADEFRALVERDEVKARLKATTEAAVARGVFGVPTFFVGGEMFFGQDRLDFVEEALAAVPA